MNSVINPCKGGGNILDLDIKEIKQSIGAIIKIRKLWGPRKTD